MDIEQEIRKLAIDYSQKLNEKIVNRVEEMKKDDFSHYLIYKVLGISEKQGNDIDIYQNKGRFLYKYAGSFLEDATKMCFKYKYPESGSIRIENTEGKRPKTFEIDCLVGNKALEIKWRDATTDGDHITKEHTRIKAIENAGYVPIRVMFYYPNREQAIKIQNALKTLYLGLKGEYYSNEEAWQYVRDNTGVDLKHLLENIAKENVKNGI